MALTKNHVADSGLEAPGAYHKITSAEVRSRGTDTTMVVRVSTYKDKAVADADGVAISHREYNLGAFDKRDDSATAYAKAYAGLKSIGDFLDAVDA